MGKKLWSEEWKKKEKSGIVVALTEPWLSSYCRKSLYSSTAFLHEAAIGRMSLGTNPSQFARLLMRK